MNYNEERTINMTNAEIIVLRTLIKQRLEQNNDAITLVERAFVYNSILDRLTDLVDPVVAPTLIADMDKEVKTALPADPIIPPKAKKRDMSKRVYKPMPAYAAIVGAASTFKKGEPGISKALAEEFGCDPAHVIMILAQQAKYIEELRDLPEGQPRFDYLRKVFNFAGGDSYRNNPRMSVGVK